MKNLEAQPFGVRAIALGLSIIALVAAFMAFATTASAATTPTSPDISPRHNCHARLRDMKVGDSANCVVRVNNDNDALTAEDVTFYFSNTNLSVSNISVRIGSGGAATPLPGVAGNTSSPFVPAYDVPAGSGLYVFFTVTRTSLAQGAPRYPIVCASGTYTRPTLPTPTTYVATECSQGGAY